jgi:hypothetical protein
MAKSMMPGDIASWGVPPPASLQAGSGIDELATLRVPITRMLHDRTLETTHVDLPVKPMTGYHEEMHPEVTTALHGNHPDYPDGGMTA